MIVRLIVFFQPTFRIPHSPVAAYWSLHLTHRSPIIPAPRVAEVRTHKGRGRMSGSVTSFRKWNRARITNWRHTEMFSIRTHTHTHTCPFPTIIQQQFAQLDSLTCTSRHSGVVSHTHYILIFPPGYSSPSNGHFPCLRVLIRKTTCSWHQFRVRIIGLK